MPKPISCFRIVYLVAIAALALFPQAARCQQSSQIQPQTPPSVDDDTGGKHIFGIIPNYRTSPSLADYKPLPWTEKFKIARQDVFDQGTLGLAAAFAGFSQLNNTNQSFGQGVKGYSHRLVTSCADYAIGDFMTEAIYPSLLHQDPRYFRRGHGSSMSRLGYSFGQILVTHGDSGHKQINYSELLGNATSVGIGMSYYPDNRNAKDAVASFGTQLLVDALSNTLKEFWPDLNRKFSHPKDTASGSGVR